MVQFFLFPGGSIWKKKNKREKQKEKKKKQKEPPQIKRSPNHQSQQTNNGENERKS